MIKLHVDAVLVVSDGFTGRALERNALRCFVDGRLVVPQYKEGGCFVFMHLEKGSREILLKGANYADERIEVTVDGVTCPLLSVTMKPTAKRLGGASVARLTIKTKNAGSELWLAARKKGEELKLAQDEAAAGDTNAKLFYRTASEDRIVNRNYLVQDKTKSEVVTVLYAEDGDTEFGAPLKKGHKRGTPLYQAQHYVTDANGELTAYFKEAVPVSAFDPATGKMTEAELVSGENTLEL